MKCLLVHICINTDVFSIEICPLFYTSKSACPSMFTCNSIINFKYLFYLPVHLTQCFICEFFENWPPSLLADIVKVNILSNLQQHFSHWLFLKII